MIRKIYPPCFWPPTRLFQVLVNQATTLLSQRYCTQQTHEEAFEPSALKADIINKWESK